MQDLKLSDGVCSYIVAEFRKRLEGFARRLVSIWYPATSLTHKAKEEGPALVYPAQTNLHNILVLGSILFGYAPAQVDVQEPQSPSLAPLAQLRKNSLHQVVTFAMHIVERAADEYVNLLPSKRVAHLFSPETPLTKLAPGLGPASRQSYHQTLRLM